METELWLRIDTLHCTTTKCQGNKDGYSFLPSSDPDKITPEVFCGCCSGRVDAEFMSCEKREE